MEWNPSSSSKYSAFFSLDKFRSPLRWGNRPSILVMILICISWNSLPLNPIAAQTLDQIRSDARSPDRVDRPPSRSSKNRNAERSRHHHHDDCEDQNNFLGSLITAFLATGNDDSTTENSIRSPSSSNDIQYELYNDSQTTSSNFFSYPYQAGDGILNQSNSDSFVSRNQINFQTSFWFSPANRNLDSWNGKFRLDSLSGWGGDIHWAHLREQSPGVATDSLNLIDINLTGVWLESEVFLVRSGFGINIMSDRVGTQADYNLTTSADLFPIKPVVISFEVDHGELGSIHQTHLAGTLGVSLRHVEAFAGYEYRKIGPTEIKGPMYGLRIWY